MTNLFVSGDFALHSGDKSRWKIDCDALTDADWQTLALMAAERLPPFRDVIGVPTGGWPFAEALRPHYDPKGCFLIVDDVLTTGKSMEAVFQENRDRGMTVGCVVFARGKCPAWIKPLFRME